MKRVLAMLALLAIACLATYLPMRWKNMNLQRQAAETRQELTARLSDVESSLRMARLQNQLGQIGRAHV